MAKRKPEIDYYAKPIIHVMADGSVRDSIQGYITDVSQLPPVAARLMRDIMLGKYKKEGASG